MKRRYQNLVWLRRHHLSEAFLKLHRIMILYPLQVDFLIQYPFRRNSDIDDILSKDINEICIMMVQTDD